MYDTEDITVHDVWWGRVEPLSFTIPPTVTLPSIVTYEYRYGYTVVLSSHVFYNYCNFMCYALAYTYLIYLVWSIHTKYIVATLMAMHQKYTTRIQYTPYITLYI